MRFPFPFRRSLRYLALLLTVDFRAYVDPTDIFDVAPDFESYEYTPLDFVADRAFIEAAWSWTGEVEGKAFADGKVFVRHFLRSIVVAKGLIGFGWCDRNK